MKHNSKVSNRPEPAKSKINVRSGNVETNPVLISKAISLDWHHVILHKKGKGYSYTVFWAPDKKAAEPVATGFKIYKTKHDCIKAIKKLYDATPKMMRDGYTCFDYKQKRVDCEIKYDVKKLL